MSENDLTLKYRPKILDHVIGQDSIIKQLKNDLDNPDNLILSGPPGTGKTTTARILATNWSNIILEHDGGNYNTKSDIAKLLADLRKIPLDANGSSLIDWSIIIDEAHQITDTAYNAMLKTLEDKDVNARFIFCTTKPWQIVRTIHDRCKNREFKSLSADDITLVLTEINKIEKLGFEVDVLRQYAEYAMGSMRNAISMMQDKKDISTIDDSAKTILNSLVQGKYKTALDAISTYDGDYYALNEAMEQKIAITQYNLIQSNKPEVLGRVLFVANILFNYYSKCKYFDKYVLQLIVSEVWRIDNDR